MQRYKSLVLPIALVGGYFLRHFCSMVSVLVPYVIFTILVLNFSGVVLSKLRPGKLDFWTAMFQTVVCVCFYLVVIVSTNNEVLAQGAMMCVLCPVASSVTVVSSMLGADPKLTTTYTIVGNLLVALVAPLLITAVTDFSGNAFLDSLWLIFCKISLVIALPFFLVLFLQRCFPAANRKISDFKHYAFYLWSFALFVTIGQTADFVVEKWHGDVSNVVWLGVLSLAICILQFAVGRMIGRRYGDTVAGGQLLGQKNSAMGIWMINTFLNPVASVGLAFYSVWQNIFNSWQIYRASGSGKEK